MRTRYQGFVEDDDETRLRVSERQARNDADYLIVRRSQPAHFGLRLFFADLVHPVPGPQRLQSSVFVMCAVDAGRMAVGKEGVAVS